MGPFHLVRRCEEVGPDLGLLYEARHVGTGTAALMLRLGEHVDWQPEGPWRVQLTCRPAPTRVTLEVKQAPSAARVSELANILVLMAASVERVENNAQVQAHLARGSAGFAKQWAGRARHLGSSWKGVAVAGLAVVTLGVWLHAARGAGCAQPQKPMPTLTSDALTLADAPHSLTDMGPSHANEPNEERIAYPLPPKPFRDQSSTPCRLKMGEEEINGGCWVEIARRPPCTEVQAEYQGKCYLPVSKKRDREPRSSHP
ncbi:hypothetical protein F0U63_27380 [Cystobacter fuscus]|nr:hypothetical protein F0U63_27380 [Cystobacter fuscus]